MPESLGGAQAASGCVSWSTGCARCGGRVGLYLAAEPTQIEVVLYIVLVDLAEELIASQAAEPGDPGLLLRREQEGRHVMQVLSEVRPILRSTL